MIRLISHTRWRDARVGRDVLDPDEVFGLYPHNELARAPERVLDAWQLLGEWGYLPGAMGPPGRWGQQDGGAAGQRVGRGPGPWHGGPRNAVAAQPCLLSPPPPLHSP